MAERTPPGLRQSKISWTNVWTIVGAVGTLAGLIVAVLAWLRPQTPEQPPPTWAKAADRVKLEQAHQKCSTGELADADHTLVIKVAGEEANSYTPAVKGLYCILDFLETPRSVQEKMASTRMLDGMQSATWGKFEAIWTFSADDGLDLTITVK